MDIREKIGRWILFILMLPFTMLVSFPVFLFLVIFQLINKIEIRKYGIITARMKIPFINYSFCLGRLIVLTPNAGLETFFHETIHLIQLEISFITSFFLGIFVFLMSGHFLTSFLIWFSGFFFILFGYVTAWLQGGNIYWSSEFEKSARSQTKVTFN
jgi:hypothetical protein